MLATVGQLNVTTLLPIHSRRSLKRKFKADIWPFKRIPLPVVVVVQFFLSDIVPLAEMAGFTSFLPQLFVFRLSALLDLNHPFQTNLLSLLFDSNLLELTALTCY